MRNKSREAFRNEWKYLISTSEKEMLTLRLKPFLQPDPHAGEGGYYIRSLYFDDYWNSAYAEKEAGVLMRKKYRIRIYNNNDKFIKLERKKKFGSYIYKESAPLTREEVEKILKGTMRSFAQSPLSMPGILHRMYLQYDAAKDHCGLRTDSRDPGCRNGKDHL